MTTSLTLRGQKGSPLTTSEMDANFTNLRTTADGAAAGLLDKADTTYVDVKVTDLENGLDQAIDNLKDGVTTDGDTLAKLRGLISAIESLIGSNDINLDSVQEIVDYIKANRDLIESITTSKVSVSDIVAGLTSTSSTKVLAASQGKALKDLIDALTLVVDSKLTASGLKTINGESIIGSGDITINASSQVQLDEVVLTVTTNGQTVFTVPGGYTVNAVELYVDGVKMEKGTDFTATNGTSITLTTGRSTGQRLTLIRMTAFDIANHAHQISDVTGLQGALEGKLSADNLKTINGETLVGSGNLALGSSVTLTGNLSIYVTQSTTLTITNYDSATAYSVTATGGTVSISGDQITYTAGNTAGSYAINITAGAALRAVAVTVNAAAVAAPTITAPTAGQTGLGQTPTITTAAFATIGLADTQLNSDWEIRTATNGGGTLIASSMADATNKLSWTVPGNLLAVATTYYARVRHRGTTLGAGGWSEVSFITAATFSGVIGTQGTQGFGVGVYPGTLPSGFSAMTGASDKTSANYGNYQYSDGSVMVFVPKFFYRIGHASSPRFATYGANAIDIVGIEAYANETAANAAGYALHRAFVDGGSEKSGFFIDKYLCSKSADGVTSGRSIQNGVPISLTTLTTYTRSQGMTGCTGILADAVVLSRARGAGVFNLASIFMYSALAMLSLAHGQAATGTANCAWYDATGTTNFPKGCNNGALADTDDATVTFTPAGDSGSSAKPKTGSASNLAKTTHNGQACGVTDINGAMYQVMLGVTMAGTSATDTAQNTTGTAYVLKRSVALASLTGGYGGSTDAWGTTTSLGTNFDVITGFEPWIATIGWVRYGNGSNQVFKGDPSGTDYLRTCSGIPLLTGTNATGTNQFGVDGCYQYGIANQVPIASGGWVSAAGAGAFYRYWFNSRSSADGGYGFRACAYGS